MRAWEDVQQDVHRLQASSPFIFPGHHTKRCAPSPPHIRPSLGLNPIHQAGRAFASQAKQSSEASSLVPRTALRVF